MTRLGRSMIVLTLALVPTLVACRTYPIYNVHYAPVTTEKPLTLDQVAHAIERAGYSLGWQMQPTGPGLIVGTLYLRSHMAQVNIPYTTSGYSITYRDSTGLGYDGTNIHRNYNSWVQNLDQAHQLDTL